MARAANLIEDKKEKIQYRAEEQHHREETASAVLDHQPEEERQEEEEEEESTLSDTNCVASDLTADHMEAAEQDSLSTTSRATEPGSCSRPFRSEEENWLQLGLGQAKPSGLAAPEPNPRNMVELDLLSAKPTAPGLASLPHASEFPLHPPAFYLHQHGVDGITGFGLRPPEYLWNFRQMPYSSSVAWNVPCSPLPAARPSPSSSLMKIVDAPPRPNSGLWFVLQAEQKQIKELILPQVQKSYLRIKDGKMTVLLIMKYLANKLRLKSESENEKTKHIVNEKKCYRNSVCVLCEPKSTFIALLVGICNAEKGLVTPREWTNALAFTVQSRDMIDVLRSLDLSAGDLAVRFHFPTAEIVLPRPRECTDIV
ncbi:E3 ubiquitin protein ligase [Nymphaea thermarum]|nr:E3 ubiquitin protein ligase [Nymphaea thermarum]